MWRLRVQNIKKIYGSGSTTLTAVDNVNFEVADGEIVLIMGPSGSGKTTLLLMVGGLLTPTSGSITLGKFKLGNASAQELSSIRLREVGFVFQSFNILQNLNALENVEYVGQLAGMSRKEARQKAAALLTRLHLEARMHAMPSELSGGQQQRVSVGRALMNDPHLLLADEPTGNLDSRSGHEVMMLFHNIAKEEGRSVVIVSHDQRIRDIADRTLWIEDGRVSTAPRESADLQPDPVCGMRIDVAYAPFTKTVRGKTFVFCSEDCRKKFRG